MEKPIGMVDSWVKDCEACKAVTPMMEQIAKQFLGKI
jgi:hypothetical protein